LKGQKFHDNIDYPSSKKIEKKNILSPSLKYELIKMLSRFRGLFRAKQCILSEANSPLRKTACVVTAIVGCVGTTFAVYKTIPYVGNKFLSKMTISSPPTLELPEKLYKSKMFKIGIPTTVLIVLTGIPIILLPIMFLFNRETYRAIKNTTKCCDIMRFSAINTAISSVLIVLCLASVWTATSVLEDVQKEMNRNK